MSRPTMNKSPESETVKAPADNSQAQTPVETRPDRRQTVIDRRIGLDSRQRAAEETGYSGPERRSAEDRRADTGLERRRGPGRRRSDDRRSAEEGEMTTEQFEFVMAIEM